MKKQRTVRILAVILAGFMAIQTPMSVLGAEVETEPASPQEQVTEYTEGKVSVVYSDAWNLSGRRNLDGAELLEVYADGVPMASQPEITLDSNVPEEYYGAQLYTYTIHNLPIYRGETEEQVVYTVKETEVIPGYTACSAEAFPAAETAQAEGLLFELAAPQEEVNLVQADAEHTIQAEKKFGNYLPSYAVSGTVTWSQADAALSRPEMESYFQNQFTILREGDTENYTAYKMHYTQSEENTDVWNYTIEGLFTTRADGSPAAYILKAGAVEGFQEETAEIRIDADTENAKIKYQARETEERAMADTWEYEGKTSVSVKKEWIDNNDSYKKRFDLWGDADNESTLKLQYQTDGAAEWSEWEKGDLGIEVLETDRREAGTGTEIYTVSNLPEKEIGAEGAEKEIRYRLAEADVTDRGYMRGGSDSEPGKIINTIVTTEDGETALSFQVKLNIGAVADKKEDGEWKDFFGNVITIQGKASEEQISGATLTELGENVSWTSEPDKPGEYTVSVKNLPVFTEEGEEIIYSLTMESTSAEEETDDEGDTEGVTDTYEPVYDNAASFNFGTITDRCHKGGKLIITLTGKQNYMATKHWMDDESEETIANRPKAELYLWRYSDRSGNSYREASMMVDWLYTIPTDQGKEVAIIEENLEKYDQEGYKYIYFTKEVLSGNSYEQHMGKYNPTTGKYEEELPDGVIRDNTDRCIYNGGHISNTIVGDISLSLTKTWKAAAFQYQISDVKAEFTLQSRPKNADNAVWKDTDKVTMDGFASEVMSKSTEVTASRYDKAGQELEYRWIESDVFQGGQSVLEKDAQGNPILDAEGRAAFVLKQKGFDGVEQEIRYHSVRVTEEDNPNKTTIYNEIADTTNYKIEKIWKPQGESVSPIEIVLYQGNNPYVTYEMKGTADTEWSVAESATEAEVIGVEGMETEAWKLEFRNLPKYDKDGHEYVYFAVERPVEGYHTDYKYDLKERITTITNTKSQEGGELIRIRKEWLDDGDVARRVPVKIEVYQESTQEVIEEVTLTKDILWRTEVALPKGVSAKDCRIREVDNDESADSKSQMTVEADEKYGQLARTKYHQYQVTYIQNPAEDPSGLNMFVVRNKRVGAVNIDVEKNWVDGNLEPEKRLKDATLELICEEYPDAVKKATDTVELEDMKPEEVDVVQTVSTEGEKNYKFYNLPKYDKDGKVVHYTVKENYPSGDTLDYTQQYEYGEYVTDDERNVDTWTITITNRKTGTKEVKFYKSWKDVYNFKNGLRPDIYLTLYEKTSKDEEPREDEEYKDRLCVKKDSSDYEWECTFGELPKYDKYGAEIFYYARENSKVDRAKLDYLVEDEDIYTGKDEVFRLTDGKQVLKENGTFVNRISSSVKIEGKKIWVNVPEGTPAADFPKLKIHLDRNAEGAAPEQTEKDVATTEKLAQGKSNEFTFEVLYEGENPVESEDGTALPKYDDDGNLYVYSVRETVTGEEKETYNKAYEENPEIHTYTIRNTYRTGRENTGRLQVKKTWSGHLREDGIYPAVEFELWRQYQSSDPTRQPEFIEKIRIDAAENTGENTKVTKAFSSDNLRIYAPNGTEYQYYIIEKAIHGYVSTTSGGESVAGGIKSASFNLKGTGEIPGASHEVEFKNVYEPDRGTVSLTGTKVWEDWDGTLGNRPSLSEFQNQIKVYRYADAQNIKDGGAPEIVKEDITSRLQDKEEADAFYLEWKQDASRWTYTISNLDRYAPNSMPWKYVVVEEGADGYKGSPTVTVNGITTTGAGIKTVNENNGNITMQTITNNCLKSASVIKEWGDKNDCNFRPTQIGVRLQFRTGKEGPDSWQEVSCENFEKALGKELPLEEKDFAARLPGDYVVTETAGGWKYTVNHLPAQIGGTEFYYRFIEISVGEDKITVENIGDTDRDKVTYPPAGGYQPEQKGWSSTGLWGTDTTTIKNNLDNPEQLRTSLKVIKKWEDGENAYNTRPVSPRDQTKWEIKVKLQRTVPDAGVPDSDKWEDVKDVQGNTVVKRISGGLNSDVPGEVVFDELPFYSDDKNSVPYDYQAVELPDDANISIESMGYRADIDTVSGQGNAQSAETITNILNTTSLILKKEWKDVNANPTTPEEGTRVFFEIKKKPGSEEVSFDTPKMIVLDGKTDETETKAWEATVNGLPKIPGVAYAVHEMIEKPDGSYEKGAPLGYELSESTDTGEAGYTSTVSNMRRPGSVSILKVDDTQTNPTALNGAEFRLTKTKEADGTGVNEGFDFAFTSGKTYEIADGKIEEVTDSEKVDGVLTIRGLDWGTYILEETKAPEGYKLEAGQTVTFEITRTNRDLTAETDGHKVVNVRTAIVLKKTDIKQNTKLLSGAEFTIEPRSASDAFAGDWENSRKATIKTGEDGTLSLEGRLIGGNSYVLTETKAPNGYVLPGGDAGRTVFTVNPDGTIDNTGKTEVMVENRPITISLLKRFREDVEETGVAGAELTVKGIFARGTETDQGVVTDENPENTITWITGEEARTFTGAFVQGREYTLTETKAPEGAAVPTDKTASAFVWKFRVDDKGDINVTQNGAAGTLTWDEETGMATLWNQPTGLAVYKKGMDTEGNPFADKLLSDCTFEITGRFAPARYQNTMEEENGNAGNVETVRVTTNGEDTADNALKGRLIAGETYVIREIAAPDGYALGTEVRFTVKGAEPGADGIAKTEIELAEGEENKGYEIITDKDGNPVIMQRDYPIELMIEKVNEKGETLAGAEFEVRGVFAGETEESARTFVSDKTGCIDLSKMVSGYNETAGKPYIYKLQEKQAPGGYRKLAEPIYFRLASKENGGVIPDTYVEILYGDGQTPEKYKESLNTEQRENTLFLTVKNEKEIKKPSEVTGSTWTAKTGDDSRGVRLLLAAMAISIITAAVVLIRRKRG